MRTRRATLQAGFAFLTSGIATPAFAGLTSEVRSLSFDNLHTGEKLSVDYWKSGRYEDDALAAVNRVLRDHRNGEEHVIEPKLLDLLSFLHRTVDSNAPFSVISGYRSPASNAVMHERSAGVAAHSLHMEGMAIDIRLADSNLRDLHRAALAMRAGGVGYYPKENFIHVDVGRVRRWGPAG